MTVPFDPKLNKTPHLIKNIILGCKNNECLGQRTKEPSTSGVRKFLNKIVHWFKYANERISPVRDVLNRQLFQNPQNNEETANLYANCRIFNSEVIQKHNSSWISFFLFWDRVPLLDSGRLSVLENNMKRALENQLGAFHFHHSQTLIDQATIVTNTHTLLTQTMALKESSLSSTYSDLETAYTKKIETVGSEIQQKLQVYSEMDSLAEDFLKITQFIRSLAEMKSSNKLAPGLIPYTSQLESLALEDSQAQNKLKELEEKQARKEECEQELQAILANKFISPEKKRELRTAKTYQEWETKVADLKKKILMAQTVQYPALREEAKQLTNKKPAAYPECSLAELLAKLNLIEKIQGITQKWAEYGSQVQITQEIRDLHNITLEIGKTDHPDMLLNPAVVAVHALAHATFARIHKFEQECAKWRNHFQNHTKLLHRNAVKNPESMDDTLFDEKEFNLFLQNLPEGDTKKALGKQAEEYKTLLTKVKPFQEAYRRIVAFENAVSTPLTLNDYQELERLASSYTEPTFLEAFQAGVNSLRGGLLDQLVEHISSESTSISTSNVDALQKMCEDRTRWTEMKTLLKQLASHTKDDVKTAQALLERFQRIATAFDAFLTEYNLSRTRKENEPSASQFVPGTHPPLVAELGLDHPVSKIYLEMILREYIRVHLEPKLQQLSKAVNQTDGSDLILLQQSKNFLIKEIDRIAPSETSDQLCVAFRQQCIEIEKRLDELDKVRDQELILRELLKKGGSPRDVLERANTLCSICAGSLVHRYVDTTKQFAEEICTNYTDIQSLAQKVEAFRLEDEASFEGLCKEAQSFEEVEASLTALSQKYPDQSDVKSTREKLNRLKEMIPAYVEFRDRTIPAIAKEIEAREAAVDQLGVIDSPLHAPDFSLSPLVTLLGKEHPLIKGFMNRCNNMEVRRLVQGLQDLQFMLQGGVRTHSRDHQLSVKIEELDKGIESLRTVVPQLVKKYEDLTAPPRHILNERAKARKDYPEGWLPLLNILASMSESPESIKKEVSLGFFTRSKGIDSFYIRARNLLAFPSITLEDRQIIEKALACFPDILFQEIQLVHKCASAWRSNELPAFTREEVQKIKEFIRVPKQLPFPLAQQFALLLRMQELNFHPSTKCSLSGAALVDPAATIHPVQYYNREDLQQWLATSNSMRTAWEAKPKLGALVQDWLLCKDILHRQPGKRTVGYLLSMSPLKKCIDQHTRFQNERAYHYIQGYLHKWNSQGYHTKFVIWTNELAWKVAAESDDVPTYVSQLYQLAENLSILNLNFRKKLNNNPIEVKNQMRTLEEYTQLLRILLSLPNAFNDQNFKETQRLVTKMLSDAHMVLNNLLYQYVDQSFEGDIPSPDYKRPPPAATVQLLLRLHVRNHLSDIRSSMTPEEFLSYLHEAEEQQRVVLTQKLEMIIQELKPKIEEAIHQIEEAEEEKRAELARERATQRARSFQLQRRY